MSKLHISVSVLLPLSKGFTYDLLKTPCDKLEKNTNHKYQQWYDTLICEYNSEWHSCTCVIVGGGYCEKPTSAVDLYWYTENGTVQCECGLNVHRRIDDIGDAGNWPLFPIQSLKLGDTGFQKEKIYFRVGPLVCQQGTMWKLNMWFRNGSFIIDDKKELSALTMLLSKCVLESNCYMSNTLNIRTELNLLYQKYTINKITCLWFEQSKAVA